MPFMAKNQMNHQESGTENLQKLTSKPGPLLPKPVLWFKPSQLYLINIPLIIVTLGLTLHIFQLNITLNLFHIQTQLQSNQMMVMKSTIYYNYFTQNIMKIFQMLKSRCFRIDQWSPLLQSFIESIMCCFTKKEEIMFQ